MLFSTVSRRKIRPWAGLKRLKELLLPVLCCIVALEGLAVLRALAQDEL